MTIHQATVLLDTLDDIAHRLAFDAQPGERTADPHQV